MIVTSTGVRFSFCAATSPPNPPPRINTRCRAAIIALLFCNRSSAKIIHLVCLPISDARCPRSDSYIFRWTLGYARRKTIVIAVGPHFQLHLQRTVPLGEPCARPRGARSRERGCAGPCGRRYGGPGSGGCSGDR